MHVSTVHANALSHEEEKKCRYDQYVFCDKFPDLRVFVRLQTNVAALDRQ